METIHHLVSISAPPQRVHDWLTTTDGLAGRWRTTVKGNAGPGGVIDFTFRDGFGPDTKVASG